MGSEGAARLPSTPLNPTAIQSFRPVSDFLITSRTSLARFRNRAPCPCLVRPRGGWGWGLGFSLGRGRGLSRFRELAGPLPDPLAPSAIDGYRPEPTHVLRSAAGLIDAADVPLAAVDDVVWAVFVDPRTEAGRAHLEGHVTASAATLRSVQAQSLDDCSDFLGDGVDGVSST